MYSSADYHVNNLVSPVLFHEGLCMVPENAVVVEIAPHALLQVYIAFVYLCVSKIPKWRENFLSYIVRLSNYQIIIWNGVFNFFFESFGLLSFICSCNTHLIMHDNSYLNNQCHSNDRNKCLKCYILNTCCLCRPSSSAAWSTHAPSFLWWREVTLTTLNSSFQTLGKCTWMGEFCLTL